MMISYKYLSLAVAIVLSGCVKLLPEQGPAPAQVTLAYQGPGSTIQSAKTLQIQDITAPINLSGPKIVIKKKDEEGLEVFKVAKEQEWTQSLPKMLQRTVTNYFKSPQWPGVVGDNKTVVTDYQLQMDVKDFNIILNEGVEVAINVSLYDNHNNKIIAFQDFTYTIKSVHNVTGYMTAFNQALSQFLKDLEQMLRGYF